MTDTTAATTTTIPKKHAVDMQEVQETVSRLAAHKGVTAVLILNANGDIVTQSGGGNNTDSNGGSSGIGNPKLLAKMLHAANMYVCSMPNHKDDDDDGNENATDGQSKEDEVTAGSLLLDKTKKEEKISFVRIRTQRDEILVAPKFGFTLVVLQDPSVSSL